MTKIRPYLALDLESTGLNIEKSHILQIGWVIDDGVSPQDQLQKGSIIIKEETISYGEFFALGMNGWLFKEMSSENPKYPVRTLAEGLADLQIAIEKTSELAEAFDEEQGEKYPSKKVQLAGKNVGNFDWPIILNNINRTRILNCVSLPLDKTFWLKTFIDHRFIDVGAAFYEIFGKNPGFNKINELMGYKEINHDALDDAMNVVVALRYRMGMNF